MLDWLRKRLSWMASLFSRSTPPPLPPVVFHALVAMDSPPPVATIAADTLYIVAPHNTPKWAMFRCPCGCGETITLSLQQAHKERWQLEITQAQRGSLHPSVWRTTGCRSHFWLKDGRIFWA